MSIDLTSKDLGAGIKEIIKSTGAIAGDQQQADNWVSMADKILGIVKEAGSLFDKIITIKKYPNMQQGDKPTMQTKFTQTTMDKEPETEGSKEIKQIEVDNMTIEKVKVNFDMIFSTIEALREESEKVEEIKSMKIEDYIASKLPRKIKGKTVEESLKFILSNKYIVELAVKDKFEKYKRDLLKVD